MLNREEPENPITSEEDCGFEFSEIIEEIAVSEPTLGEVKEATKGLKNGKAPGIDSIIVELLKADVEVSADKMRQLMIKIWKGFVRLGNNLPKKVILRNARTQEG